MACAAARIGEALPCLGYELPVVAVELESELENAEGGGVAQLAVGLRGEERAMILATRADDKFANAARRIGSAVRCLRAETFVVVVVAIDDASVIST